MALMIHAYEDGQVRPWAYLPAFAATYVVGQAMVMDASNGYLVSVASGVGQDTDEGKHYVCMSDITVGTNGDPVPVVASDDQMVWEIPLQANMDGLKVGLGCDLYTDGQKLTTAGSAAKACFTVLSFDGKAAGDLVRGKLV